MVTVKGSKKNVYHKNKDGVGGIAFGQQDPRAHQQGGVVARVGGEHLVDQLVTVDGTISGTDRLRADWIGVRN